MPLGENKMPLFVSRIMYTRNEGVAPPPIESVVALFMYLVDWTNLQSSINSKVYVICI